MPFNGSGTYSAPSLPGSWNPAISGQEAVPADWNSLLTDLSTALSTMITRDGQSTVTANIPMSGFKFTGVGDATARTQYASMGQIQDGKGVSGTVGGTADAITLTTVPVITAYALNQVFRLIATGPNTIAGVTLNVDTVGAGPVVWPDGTALSVASIKGGEAFTVMVADISTPAAPVFHLQTIATAPTPLFYVPTGGVLPYIGTAAPTGWLLLSGKTIGNGSSGGTARANADTATLYALLWDSFSDAICPVSTGRGANAAADFAANKTITLIDARGRVIAGPDAMGGTAANRLGTGPTGGITGSATPGASGGEQSHVQTLAELRAHTHAVPAQIQAGNDLLPGAGFAAGLINDGSSGSAGTSAAANILQPTLVLNYIIKM